MSKSSSSPPFSIYPFINSPFQHSTYTRPRRPDPFLNILPPSPVSASTATKSTYIYYNRYAFFPSLCGVILSCLGVALNIFLGCHCYSITRNPPEPTIHHNYVQNACSPLDLTLSLVPGIGFVLLGMGLLAMFRERVVVYWITGDFSPKETPGRDYVKGKPGLGKVIIPSSLTVISPWSEGAFVDEMYERAVEGSKRGGNGAGGRGGNAGVRSAGGRTGNVAGGNTATSTPVASTLGRAFSRREKVSNQLQQEQADMCKVISSPEAAGPNRNSYVPWVPPPARQHTLPRDVAGAPKYQNHYQGVGAGSRAQLSAKQIRQQQLAAAAHWRPANYVQIADEEIPPQQEHYHQHQQQRPLEMPPMPESPLTPPPLRYTSSSSGSVMRSNSSGAKTDNPEREFYFHHAHASPQPQYTPSYASPQLSQQQYHTQSRKQSPNPNHTPGFNNLELQPIYETDPNHPLNISDLEKRNKGWNEQRRREILGNGAEESEAESAAWLPNWVRGGSRSGEKGKGKQIEISGPVF